MITNVSLFTLWVTDIDASKRFYLDTLGFVENTDVTMGDNFRWCTISHPRQLELEITLMIPGPPLDPPVAEAIARSLANGSMGGFGLATDDCRKDYEELSAKGVQFVQVPAERPYGVEAVMRDNAGNWIVLVEHKEFTGEEFAHP